MAVNFLQAHGLGVEFLDDSPQFDEERLEPLREALPVASWHPDHAGFKKLHLVRAANDNAVTSDV
jgi:hypothetical protein